MILPNISAVQSIPVLAKSITGFPPPTGVPSIPGLPSTPTFRGTVKDVVAVFDDSYNQMFQLARAIKINVSPSAKLMDHPIEDGATRTDFRIINPTEIELSVICTGAQYAAVYQQIKTAYLSGNVYTVTTKADVYFNMMIQSIPHDEIPDMFDVIAVGIKMREVIQIATQYQPLPAKKVRNKNDQSKVNAGTVAPVQQSAIASLIYGQ